MKISKEAYVKFKAESVGNVYMLRNSKVTVGELQLSSALKMAVVKQSETTMVLSLDFSCIPKRE